MFPSVPLRTIAGALLLAVVLAACGTDDGAVVREIGTDSGSVSGSASGSGSASAPAAGSGSASAPSDAGGEAVTSDGPYEYASDVSAHRLVVLDVCAVKELLDEGEESEAGIDYAAIEAVYRDGVHSVNADGSVRTLAGFAGNADALHGLADHFGSPTPLEDFVGAALSGTGPFEGEPDPVRAQGVEKGVQNQVMVGWVVHEMAEALRKAEAGDIDPATGAVHNWDEAWAFYHGAAPDCAPWATAQSRADNFGTLDADGVAGANARIVAAMDAGREAALAGDVDALRAAADEVTAGLVTTYSQAAIRYAEQAVEAIAEGDAEEARIKQAEGLAFWRVIAPTMAEAGADVAAVDAVLSLDAEPGGADGDAVRAALQPALDALGITAEDIGALQ